jgi:hypothetical protein
MAEGSGIDGLLDGEPEEGEGAAAGAGAGADAVALSLALLAKYDQALNYAPNWAALKEVREAAAKQKP